MKKRFVSVLLIFVMGLSSIVPIALGMDSKYMHFREITIDGSDDDWNGIPSHAFITKLRQQNGTMVYIDNKTFYPGNVSLPKGDVVAWKNLDDDTTTARLHQITLNEDAPYTWTGDTMEYLQEDYLLPRKTGNYSYHTSRLNWYQYADGNLSVYEEELNSMTYSTAFASTQTHLYIGISITNVSDSVGDATYLKGIDIVMDDLADNSIEGENAVRITKSGSGYQAKDMFYQGGELFTDESQGYTSDIEMGYSHDIPESEGSVEYNGDFFFEIEVPINSESFYDIVSSVGNSIGLEIILKLSDSTQDENSNLIGVDDHYRGGGYPIIITRNEEGDELDLDPTDFFEVSLSGDNFFEILATIFEEAWIWILTTVSVAVSFIFGGIVWMKKKKEKGLFH